jgi:putative transposase
MSLDRRRAMIEADHPKLSIVRQCELAAISRSGFNNGQPGRAR